MSKHYTPTVYRNVLITIGSNEGLTQDADIQRSRGCTILQDLISLVSCENVILNGLYPFIGVNPLCLQLTESL